VKGRGEVSSDREACLCFGHYIEEALAIFSSSHYRVLTEYPLRKVMQKLDLSGRLANWAIKLGDFDMEFIPRNV
jgi:hypothetical protein